MRDDVGLRASYNVTHALFVKERLIADINTVCSLSLRVARASRPRWRYFHNVRSSIRMEKKGARAAYVACPGEARTAGL